MNVGDLNKRVTILRASGIERDAAGEPQTYWVEYATVWGTVVDLSGREFFAAQQVNDEVTTRIVIRYRTDVQANDLARVGGQSYDIIVPVDRRGDRRWLELMCRTQRDVMVAEALTTETGEVLDTETPEGLYV